MFKTTKKFFEKVQKDEVLKIDIENYIQTITDDYKPHKVRALRWSLYRYMQNRHIFLSRQITGDQIAESIKKTEARGRISPTIRRFFTPEQQERGQPEYKDVPDLEKMFFPYELTCLKILEKRLLVLLEWAENRPVAPPQPTKNPIYFEGKTLNLKERFEILKILFDFDKKITTLNVPVSDKNQILAFILNCNIDSAKELMNNHYDAKIKEAFAEHLTYLKAHQ